VSAPVGEELVHRYRPRGSQAALMRDRRPEILMAGPMGTGKTRACLEYLHAKALRYPGSHHLLLRKILEDLKSTALVIWRDEVIPEALATGAVVEYSGSRFRPPQFTYSNGSMVLAGGLDKPGHVLSSQFDSIQVNEATELEESEWDTVSTRKRHFKMPWQQMIGDCNPAENTHWLKLRCDAGRTYMYHTRHTENPVYFNEDGTPTAEGRAYVLGTLGHLTGVLRDRMLDGLWVTAEGVIYTQFDPSVHIVDPFPVPADWARYWAIDWGFNHPFCWQEWAEDFDGRLFLVREIYMTGRTVEEHCRTIKRLTHGSPRPQKIVVDHQKQERMIFEREMRMRTTLAMKDVLPGIHEVQQRLAARRMFFMRGSVVERDPVLRDLHLPGDTVSELPGYIWLDKDHPREGPVKRNDNGCDAKRYLVAELDLRGRLLGR
jgi:Phage terminase large subunit